MTQRSLSTAAPARGFTLLEVLVAIAIVGLALTVILSSQVGLFASTQYAHNLAFATSLVRCKMSEVEQKLLKDGYPLTDLAEEGHCCEDEDDSSFECEWKVEKIELPQVSEATTIGTDGGLDLASESDGGGILEKLGQLQSGGLEGGVGDLGQALGSTSADMSGLAPMLMGMVYPNLKPMLEASIRRVTVTVHWKEGKRAKDLSVVQFVTNPTQGLDPNAELKADIAGQAAEQLINPGGAPTGTNPSPPPTAGKR